MGMCKDCGAPRTYACTCGMIEADTIGGQLKELRDCRALLAAVAPVVKAAVVMRADYPELAPVSEINRFARNNGLRDDPRYALLAAVDALPDEARKEFGA